MDAAVDAPLEDLLPQSEPWPATGREHQHGVGERDDVVGLRAQGSGVEIEAEQPFELGRLVDDFRRRELRLEALGAIDIAGGLEVAHGLNGNADVEGGRLFRDQVLVPPDDGLDLHTDVPR